MKPRHANSIYENLKAAKEDIRKIKDAMKSEPEQSTARIAVEFADAVQDFIDAAGPNGFDEARLKAATTRLAEVNAKLAAQASFESGNDEGNA